ncbi:glycosyltransferase family 2 protein [Salegentibacter chungangensis]|uniref:Glycosyltransferase family 2 protein n=1 Tax=Salegentibacter chungangensis TaxID=1335724 RepID=A0ABW3NPY1_9FLAO
MNKNPALVSVIMPAFNSAGYISGSVRSVLEQTYSDLELIIVDDASTDATLATIQGLAAEDSRLRIIRNKSNEGAGISRNKGIEAARGAFIAFLDDDDLWKPEKLEKQLKFMQESQVKVCFSSYELISEKGEKLNRQVEALPFLTYNKLLKSNYVGNLTGIYNAGELGKIYAPEIRKRQDWGLWLEAVKKAGEARSIKEPLALYRVRRNSISGNKIEMLRYNFNIYHKVLGFGFFKSIRCMLMFLKEHFFVKKRMEKAL